MFYLYLITDPALVKKTKSRSCARLDNFLKKHGHNLLPYVFPTVDCLEAFASGFEKCCELIGKDYVTLRSNRKKDLGRMQILSPYFDYSHEEIDEHYDFTLPDPNEQPQQNVEKTEKEPDNYPTLDFKNPF